VQANLSKKNVGVDPIPLFRQVLPEKGCSTKLVQKKGQGAGFHTPLFVGWGEIWTRGEGGGVHLLMPHLHISDSHLWP
jgi:hypothetical protein